MQTDSKYMRNCIKEVLRLSPPSFILAPRVAAEGAELPKGQVIMLMNQAMHRSASNWTNPEDFNPDRFSQDPRCSDAKSDGATATTTSSDEVRCPFNDNMEAWLPFGRGERQCPGQNFALREIEVVMKAILNRYSIYLPPDSTHQEYLRTKTSSILLPINLNLVFVAL